jgi:hypothetical protein
MTARRVPDGANRHQHPPESENRFPIIGNGGFPMSGKPPSANAFRRIYAPGCLSTAPLDALVAIAA